MITLVISLSNNFYAQVRPYNDACFEAIHIPVAPETNFNEFSLEGAQRSSFAVVSTCGNDQHARDVWFAAIMPNNGKMDIMLSATKECPNLTIYTGGCTDLSYLACDASKTSNHKKTISLVDATLARQTIYIRVHQEATASNNLFKIKTESKSTPAVTVEAVKLKLEGKAVVMNWTTAGETQVNYTFIQHSTDGKNFENIQSIEGRNNNDLEHYTFKHTQPQIGTNIYRLVVHMQSGESMVLDQVEIFVEKFTSTVSVYPNPTTEGIYMAMPDWVAAKAAKFTMRDMTGKVMEQRTIAIDPSSKYYYQFSKPSYCNGNYLVQVTQDDNLIVNTQLSLQK